MKAISLYIHIPFCVSKCGYCDFLSFPSDQLTKDRYVAALCGEIEVQGQMTEEKIATIFIGGGTPTSLSGQELETILKQVYKYFQVDDDAEVSIEMNPKTLDLEILEFLKRSPINRVSIGLQSTKDEQLKKLSRIHTYSEFLDTYRRLREIGINNINADLMFGLPGQSLEDWNSSLRTIAELKLEHISAYGLIIEEDTSFYQLYKQGLLDLPNEETERKMYEMSKQVLQEYGYKRYEISNYSLNHKECRHNLAYWTDQAYLGLGLGASSYYKRRRYSNTSNMDEYLANCKLADSIHVDVQVVTKDHRLEERIFLGLRMMDGISIKKLNEDFNNPLSGVYKESLETFIKSGHLIIQGDRLKLTEKGISVSNQIFSEFLI